MSLLPLSLSLSRHHNRDAVLAHVKIHYQESSYPKSTSSGSSTSPLQVSVGSNQQQLYMNKVFAAMCLSQPSPTGGSSAAVGGNQQQQQQHSLISAGLLQRAIQEAQHSPTPNSSALSGLALALAGGKCPSTTTSTPKANAASILEHGEQKASQNEASADSLTSPTITSSSTAARSLQDLLTSPRTRHGHHFGAGASPSTATASACPSGSAQTNQNNANCYNSVVVMGGSAGSSNSNTGTGYHLESRKSLNASSTNTAPNSINNTPSPMPVTTTPTPISTFPTGAKSLVHSLGTGLSSSNSNSNNNNNNSTSNLTDTHPHNPLIAGDGIYLATGLTHALHSTNLKSKLSSTSSSLLSASASASASSSSASQASAASSPHSSPPSSSSYMPQAMTGPTTRLHSPGSPGLLTMNDADRRDPSPYRCGHCHQLSNWKHVIQVFV